MANYISAQDIINDALNRAGELTDGTSAYGASALSYLNKWYMILMGGSNEFGLEVGEPWVWAKAQYPATLTLKTPYTTGTISLTTGSTSGTFSAAPSSSLAGTYLEIGGNDEKFRIVTHTAATTSFTLDSQFNGTTASGLTYLAHYLDYDLTAAIIRLIAPFRSQKVSNWKFDWDGKIEGIIKSRFDDDYPLHRLRRGTPTHFCITRKDDTGLYTVQFSHSVQSNTRVTYDYIPLPTLLTNSGSSIPALPREHRIALSHGVTYQLMVDKNDARAAEVLNVCRASFEAMVQANKREHSNINPDYGKLIPRMDNTNYTLRYLVQEVG